MDKWQYNDGGRKAAGFQGDAAGDCVCRSIAIATGEPYQMVYDALNGIKAGLRQSKNVRGSSSRTGVHKRVYERFLFERGWIWTPTMAVGSGCKVHLKAGELPAATIICRLSRHLVAVKDGVIQDLYDCSREGTRCVYGYYQKQH